MNLHTRFYKLILWVLFSIFIAVSGSFLENSIVNQGAIFSNKFFGNSVYLFFSAVILNVILLLLFVFLTFRSGVKLIVDNSRGVFGSKLNTKLVTAFLFFSLLPTVVLLYMSTKFVNTNFEKWLPDNLVETTEETLNSEAAYQAKIYSLLINQFPNKDNIDIFDFVVDKKKNKMIYISKKINESEIKRTLLSYKASHKIKPVWHEFGNERKILIIENNFLIYGIISPKILQPKWLQLKNEYPGLTNAAKMIRLSYYVMLGVITLLIIFSATWLGFTLAREITVPLQILANATESVSHGNYSVKIDDIVSDDEMGKLALSFRSMVSDLKREKERVDLFSDELKRKAEELSIKSEYNEVLLKNVNAGVIVLSAELFIESWNQRAENLFNNKEKDVLGTHISKVFADNDFQKIILHALEDASLSVLKRVEMEWSGFLYEKEFQLQISVSLICSPRGKVGKIIFVNDISDFAKAQRLAAWKDVASRIAHEIKNPLTPIKLGAQRLEKKFTNNFIGNDKQVFKESIQIILQSTDSIKILVDEFIKYARMPHSKLNFGNIVEAIYMSMRGFIGNPENIFLILEVFINDKFYRYQNEEKFDYLPQIKCYFDRNQITRLFINLIANAVTVSTEKNTPVTVSIYNKTNDNILKIMVKDFGTGLSTEVKSRIFEPYFSTKKTGMGLGLAIVKQIVDEHFGQISVEENHPNGTIFTVTLPIEINIEKEEKIN
ncbi:sensor histidine kinase [Fluviispira multicolorata]|uniref:histidine kinase n=1 Tax=Fluviispira multicolorata TaxID=2654512 RepID=A0A833JF41_9BACT|nr:ATP-binding protein [Fluviispira multicolorata]KAB8030835.1 HAMP domain-containing protein [Fluviispira multicolorata]